MQRSLIPIFCVAIVLILSLASPVLAKKKPKPCNPQIVFCMELERKQEKLGWKKLITGLALAGLSSYAGGHAEKVKTGRGKILFALTGVSSSEISDALLGIEH